MYPIFLVVGQAGTGKDTAADYLTELTNGKKIALADPIKEFARAMFGFTNGQLYGPSKRRNEAIPNITHKQDIWRLIGGRNDLRNWVGKHFGLGIHIDVVDWFTEFIRHEETVTARHVLQTLGTECGRKNAPNRWIDYALKRSNTLLDECGSVVISDGRFRNEVLRVKAAGGIIIKVDGETNLTTNHQSEVEVATIPQFWYDVVIENNKADGLEALREKVEAVVNGLTLRF